MFPLIIIAGALLLLATASPKKAPPKELPAEWAATFDQVGGQLHYKWAVARLAIGALMYKVVFPSEQPNMVMVQPGPGEVMGPQQFGAWWGLKGLHDDGFDIWVPTNFHLPVQLAHPVLFLPPGQPPPPEGYAMLISAAQQWPEPTS